MSYAYDSFALLLKKRMMADFVNIAIQAIHLVWLYSFTANQIIRTFKKKNFQIICKFNSNLISPYNIGFGISQHAITCGSVHSQSKKIFFKSIPYLKN